MAWTGGRFKKGIGYGKPFTTRRGKYGRYVYINGKRKYFQEMYRFNNVGGRRHRMRWYNKRKYS